MRANGQMTGMLGVYLSAAELTKRGFIVSPTSRSAFGADLLVTDQRCLKAWSVQVKTNRKAASFWLVNPHVAQSQSESHIYVFVNNADAGPVFYAVPSRDVACIHKVKRRPKTTWYQVDRKDLTGYSGDEGWLKVFGPAS